MSSPSPSGSTTASPPHKYGAFDMDEDAMLRAFIVIGGISLLIAIYCLIKCCRFDNRLILILYGFCLREIKEVGEERDLCPALYLVVSFWPSAYNSIV